MGRGTVREADGGGVLAQAHRRLRDIIGVMLESFLVDGRQSVSPGTPLVYGQSITDSCMDWDTTAPLIHQLAKAVRAGLAAR